MGAIGDHFLRARSLQRRRRIAQRACRIDDIVDQDAETPLHVADDVHHLALARLLAPLVDDRERGIVEPLGQRAGADNAADVGGNDHQVSRSESRLDVGAHHRCAIEIVGRDIEKALDLPGVEIDREHAVSPRRGHQIGDQLGRNRRARAGFAILPRIAEIGHNGGNPLGRRAAQRIRDDQQLHEIVIGGVTGRLDNEHVLAADILMDFDENFFVGEAPHAGVGQRHVEIIGDGGGQRQVAVARDDLHGAT